MRHCPVCQASYEDDARFCPDDGSPLRASPDPYIGKVLLGQFEIREVCGRGSMGTVYRAFQRNMDREVAVKVLRRDLMRDPRIVKRFRREAKASARLSHPSIITVYVVGDTDDGVPFMAMEFVKGRSLDEVLAEERRLPPLRTIHIVRQICSALAEAHAQSIVHRDLKPENIFLCPTSHTPDFVKILDFGIAKILYASEESLLTQTGAIFGTPYYLSPEQASGADVDHRCDLYALGVILFRMLTGRLPFQKESGVAVLIQHLREAPPRPRELVASLPAPLEHVVLKALEKAPASRWQSAQEMGVALEAIQSYLMPGGRPPGPAPALLEGQALRATIADYGDTIVPARPDAPAAPVPPTLAQARSATPAAAAGVARERAGAGPVAGDGDAAAGPESTLGLAQGMTTRRRVLFHVVAGLASVAGGAGTGALLYFRRARAAAPGQPALAPLATAQPEDGGADLGVPPDAGPSGSVDAAPQPAASKRASKPSAAKSARAMGRPASQPSAPASRSASQPAARRAAPRRSAKRRPTGPRPVGPDPSVEGTDHGGASSGDQPEPETKNEPYEMVD